LEELNDRSAVYMKLLFSSKRKLGEAIYGSEAKQKLHDSSNIAESIRGDVNCLSTQIDTLRSALKDLSVRKILTNRVLTHSAHPSWTTELQRYLDAVQEDILKLRQSGGRDDLAGIDEKLALTRREATLTARRREGLEKSARVEDRLLSEISNDVSAHETMFLRLKVLNKF
jgi:hypothetical protein